MSEFIDKLVEVAHQCATARCFEGDPILISAGGSAFYDIVLDETRRHALPENCRVVTRSGCYLTSDAGLYENYFREIKRRNLDIGIPDGRLMDGLEVWGYVLSRPEPDRIIINVGRRDMSYDDLPIVQSFVRFGAPDENRLVDGKNFRVIDINDQHCYVQGPRDSNISVGDGVILGISHPCLTFDKWRNIYVRDENYDVVQAFGTWF